MYKTGIKGVWFDKYMLGIATQKHDTIQLISLENFALPLTNTYFDTDLETLHHNERKEEEVG